MGRTPRANFFTPSAILEVGADPGDIIVVEPTHPRVPVLVIGNKYPVIGGFDHRWLPLILDHIENFTLVPLVAQDPDLTPDQFRRWRAAVDLKSRHPSPITESIAAGSDGAAIFELLCQITENPDRRNEA